MEWNGMEWNGIASRRFSLGPSGAGAYCHDHTNAWNALIYGRKRWFLYPPFGFYGPQVDRAAAAPMTPHHHRDTHRDDTRAMTDSTRRRRRRPYPQHMAMGEWLRDVYPHLPTRPLECVQEAGEVLFVPQVGRLSSSQSSSKKKKKKKKRKPLRAAGRASFFVAVVVVVEEEDETETSSRHARMHRHA